MRETWQSEREIPLDKLYIERFGIGGELCQWGREDCSGNPATKHDPDAERPGGCDASRAAAGSHESRPCQDGVGRYLY